MKQHLENLGQIIRDFKKKYNFMEVYLSIEGIVERRVNNSLKISCMSEFDEFTLKQIREISYGLYKQLHTYLNDNNIDKRLIIRDAEQMSWAKNGTELVFEESLKV